MAARQALAVQTSRVLLTADVEEAAGIKGVVVAVAAVDVVVLAIVDDSVDVVVVVAVATLHHHLSDAEPVAVVLPAANSNSAHPGAKRP